MNRRVMSALLAGLMLLVTACGGGSTGSSDPAGGTKPDGGSKPAGGTPAAKGPKQGGDLIVGMVYEPVTMDPHVTGQANAIRILLNAFDTLVYADDKGEVHPYLAESWTINDAGTVYTFKLKQGVKFHDGTPLNAEAVKFSFDRIMDPKTASQSAISSLKPYEKSEVVDELTIKVTLTEPSAVWLKNLNSAATAPVSPAAVAKLGDAFARTPVGSGPFIVSEWKEKESITLTRNADYNWGSPAFPHKGAPRLDKLVFKFIPESQVRYSTLETGETNAIEEVPSQFVAQVKAKSDKFNMLSIPFPGSPRHAMINTQTFPTDDLAVRQAILYAVDTKAIINTLHAGAYPEGNGPMSAITWGSTKGIFRNMYPMSKEKAGQVLDAAGWKLGSDGVRVKDGKRLKLVANTLADVPDIVELTQVIQAQLTDIGMEVELKQLSRSPWYASNAKGDYNFVVMALWAIDPDMLRTLYRKDGSVFTWSHYNNPAFNALVDEAVKLVDANERLKMYKTAEKMLMDDAVVLPVWDQMNLMAVQKDIEGIFININAYPVYYATHYVQK